MDPIQELIENVEEAQVDGSARATPAVSSSADTRRTKMVFVYSDEDEDGATHGDDAAANGVTEVPCETHAIPLSEEVLAELRADAHAIDTHVNELSEDANRQEDGTGGLSFQEDVWSGLGAAASAPALTSALMSHLNSGSSGRMHVREVDAPALWDGAFSSTTADGNADEAAVKAADEMPALLRRGLPAAAFVMASRRKRFRSAEGDVAHEKEPSSSTPAAVSHVASPAGGSPSAADSAEVDEEEEAIVVEELDVLPVYEEDGKTVRALQTRCGYQLTLDERDLLENAEDEVEEEGDVSDEAAVEAPYEDSDAVVAEGVVNCDGQDESISDVAAEAATEVDGMPEEDWGDLFDGDSDEDEEEEEIDEAIVVAVAEQLVRCCEADDLDPQMRLEATRFIATAKPLLKDLTDEKMTAKDFGQKIDRDLRRFQRIYRSVYRPRDSPIVINGVVMDM
ncbi:hypothetical protein ABL78_6949 [Leptomonas seymouri]|uniref:Uncharacterized protein n=1 Tax=Leptomonas seymouri TaxID=5684 RepID=A0A0N1PA28_LEPSE|nr:hypothetical protein ABL78_6949 [Leptomonas seymouri]|eukprot:KPI84008.1 hypothetical protein ABL78_6949 [Leptomonas seymouri]